MKFILFFLFSISFLFITVPAKSQTKRALVVGLGKQKDLAWNKINGDKDVSYVLEILNNANYKQIITCVNEEATKAGIVSAFKILTDSCQPNDIVYVHYSGHGQQVKYKGVNETDALDECWIPYDAYCKPCDNDWGEKHLIDDEVNILLTNIRNKIGDDGKILVVIDACHSGDATRGDNEIVRGAEDVFEAVKSLFGLFSNEDKKCFDTNAERWIALSACESYEKNAEMKSPSVGKLTYGIYNEVKRRNFGNNTEFFKRLRRFMKTNGSRPQSPTMTGEISKYNIVDILR